MLNGLLVGFLLKNSGVEESFFRNIRNIEDDGFALVKSSLSIRVGNS